MIEETKLNQMMNMLSKITQKLSVDEDTKEVYSVMEVAKMKNISYQTAMSKIHSNEWKAINEGTKKRATYKIYKNEVDRIMNRTAS